MKDVVGFLTDEFALIPGFAACASDERRPHSRLLASLKELKAWRSLPMAAYRLLDSVSN
jgi:hypothetical protein